MRKILAVLATTALVASALPALAQPPRGMRGHDIIVNNFKAASVTNMVSVTADTGSNDAEGDDGGDGGEAGSAEDNNNTGGTQVNNGGDGGAGGAGGNGGVIVTGDATALLAVDNMVNINDTKVNACACPPETPDCPECPPMCDPCGNPCCDPCGDPCGEPSVCLEGGPNGDDCGCIDDVVVNNEDLADVLNMAKVDAYTGDNDVDGDDGGDGGEGKAADDNSNQGDCDPCQPIPGNQRNNGGDGGKGGAGGDGGLIQTGASWAEAHIMNVVNSIVNRILR
jgi:hypothetical protein